MTMIDWTPYLNAAEAKEWDTLLALLLGLWRQERWPVLATLVDEVAELLLSPEALALRVEKRKNIPPAQWAAVLSLGNTADLGVLMDTLHRGPGKVVKQRMVLLAEHEDDPRLTGCWMRWPTLLPFRATSSQPIWRQSFKRLRAIPDPRTSSALEDGLALEHALGDTMRLWLTDRWGREIEALRTLEASDPAWQFSMPSHDEVEVLDKLKASIFAARGEDLEADGRRDVGEQDATPPAVPEPHKLPHSEAQLVREMTLARGALVLQLHVQEERGLVMMWVCGIYGDGLFRSSYTRQLPWLVCQSMYDKQVLWSRPQPAPPPRLMVRDQTLCVSEDGRYFSWLTRERLTLSEVDTQAEVDAFFLSVAAWEMLLKRGRQEPLSVETLTQAKDEGTEILPALRKCLLSADASRVLLWVEDEEFLHPVLWCRRTQSTWWLEADDCHLSLFSAAFSPDARYLVLHTAGRNFLWDCESGEVLWLFHTSGNADGVYWIDAEHFLVAGEEHLLFGVGSSRIVKRWSSAGIALDAFSRDPASDDILAVSKPLHRPHYEVGRFVSEGYALRAGQSEPVLLHRGENPKNTSCRHMLRGSMLSGLEPLSGKGVGDVILVDPFSPAPVTRIEPWAPGVSCLACSADGSVVVASYGRSVSVWKDGTLLRCFLEKHVVRDLVVWPDGSQFVVVVSISPRLYPVAERGKPVLMKEHSYNVNCGAVTGKGGMIATAGKDHKIILWDASAGVVGICRGHTGAIESIAFSPDGQWLVSTGHDQTLRLWNVARRVEAAVCTIPSQAQAVWWESVDRGTVLVQSEGALQRWDIERGERLAAELPQGDFWCVAPHPAGGAIAVSNEEGVTIWRANEEHEKISEIWGGTYALAWGELGRALWIGAGARGEAPSSVSCWRWPGDISQGRTDMERLLFD